ncbi:polysaccharide biosynthesis/export family protein [Luteolibacter ambystomatis]|uniref:Polysaccharide biosynthesis/export family protein n=1 Tax=Luteolibacter ambystomatis TaxID=2824561 RepID=A0A975IYI5_9BACT|nr:polysaccharide biosynthesis/export family protein [Luteolibacter ambystomatis]QUE50174.1 polysaccharide biosynthesis/export family protein [Luteolibacter ambystomatis]
MKSFLFALLAFAGLAASASAQTTIQPGQAIKIDLRGVPPEDAARVSGEYTVSDSGNVDMPMIGPVSAAGTSPASLGGRIAAAYKAAEIYTSPSVNVIASSQQTLAKQVVHVGGRVRRSGQVEFVAGLTIYQAIQQAGGADEFGAINRVLLTRGGKVRKLDLKQEQFKSFVLEQSDTIEVPEKNIWGN